MNFEKSVTIENGEKNKKNKTKQTVVKVYVDVTIVNDAKGFKDRVIEARELDPATVKCRPVVDTGQGSFKVLVSIFDSNQDLDIAFAFQEGRYEKLTGVNRLLVLAEVDGGQERHHNIWQILERLKLHELPGLIMVGYLYITNVYLGISKHGGKCSCYICEGYSTLETGTLRTFSSLDTWLSNYEAAGSVRKDMQKYKNVINECLIKADPQKLVGEEIQLPELHLLIGVTNHYCKKLAVVWPSLVLWGSGKWIVHGRHGGGLDGANSDR